MDESQFTFLDHLNDAAEAVTLPLFRSRLAVDSKGSSHGDFDPVTEADRQAELVLRRLILERYPDDGIAGEEFPDHRPDARRVWHLDPIDGTRQFISGVPLWGTMIGLIEDGVPVLGSIAHPFTGERFYGGAGQTLYRRGQQNGKLASRPCAGLQDAILFSTSPGLFRDGKATAFSALSHSAKLTRFGVDCYAFCLVGLGFVDMVVETGLDDHDVIAAVPIIEAAGGAVVDWRGRPARGGGDVLAVGDRRLVGQAVEILGRAAG